MQKKLFCPRLDFFWQKALLQRPAFDKMMYWKDNFVFINLLHRANVAPRNLFCRTLWLKQFRK